MVAYVLDALIASRRVGRIALVGLAPHQFPAPAEAEMLYLPNRGGIIENLLCGLDALGAEEPVVYCGCDLPMLTPEAVRDLIARYETAPCELGYAVVERQVMEARFPRSGRSFRPLVEGAFCGGDLSMVSPHLVRRNAEFARALASNRKSIWGLARLMGPGILLRLLVKRLRIRDLEARASRLFGGPVRAIISPHPELAMDVDKPHHLQAILRALDTSGRA
jgi:hypothetical protein